MKLQKLFLSFGMIGTLSFILEDILGTVLWREYNPITTYISLLTADGAPNVSLTRTLFYIYEICLVIFVIGLLIRSFKSFGICLRIGYAGLLLLLSISALGFGAFPMTMDIIINIQNYIHVAITIFVLVGTILILFLLAFGYLKQERERKIGRITLTSAAAFLFFNLLHIYAIYNGINALGLIQRLSLYTFQIFIFVLSLFYVLRAYISGEH